MQLRREGAGTALVDPIAFESLEPLARALEGTEWILHAATQDLPCLAEVGLRPAALFDTELAGRLLGKPRVGLATLVEELVGQRMRKEHSAADWSTRPLPASWLEYAALDVEVLLELREAMVEELEAAGQDRVGPPGVRGAAVVRADRPRGGLAAYLRRPQAPRPPRPGRRPRPVGGARPDRPRARRRARPDHPRLRDHRRRGRDAGRPRRRCSPSRASTAAVPRATPATGSPPSTSIRDAPESELPGRPARSDGPPQPRAWAERDPVAARRLAHARVGVAALSEKHQVPVENLLTPDYLRRVLWTPPGHPRAAASSPARWAEQLRALGARQWQIELTGPAIVAAIIAADAAPRPETSDGQPADYSDGLGLTSLGRRGSAATPRRWRW